MKQRLAMGLAIASLCLCGYFLFLWLASYISIKCSTNGVAFVPRGHSGLDQERGNPALVEQYLLSLEDYSETKLSFLGFRFQSGQGTVNAIPANLPTTLWSSTGGGFGGGVTGNPRFARVRRIPEFWAIVIPYWFLILLSGAAPGWWLYTHRRRLHRVRNGLCLRCGYDLRESKDKCPECGTAVVVAVSTAK